MLLAVLLAIAIPAPAPGHRLTPPDYPACGIATQRALPPTGPRARRDPAGAHIAQRIAILQADIGTARKARHLTQGQADALWQRAARIRADADAFTRRQGFLSAGERASYDRALDAIAMRLCR